MSPRSPGGVRVIVADTLKEIIIPAIIRIGIPVVSTRAIASVTIDWTIQVLKDGGSVRVFKEIYAIDQGINGMSIGLHVNLNGSRRILRPCTGSQRDNANAKVVDGLVHGAMKSSAEGKIKHLCNKS